jgi:DNA-directed RNA polymerase I subunit RPA1
VSYDGPDEEDIQEIEAQEKDTEISEGEEKATTKLTKESSEISGKNLSEETKTNVDEEEEEEENSGPMFTENSPEDSRELLEKKALGTKYIRNYEWDKKSHTFTVFLELPLASKKLMLMSMLEKLSEKFLVKDVLGISRCFVTKFGGKTVMKNFENKNNFFSGEFKQKEPTFIKYGNLENT